ncbi:hypothetical protein TVAG_123250 [Trichomonas vaginalis G3]|uniref:Uncharacterized protein n=1 Tax=Trichomonas vaginalis (strain ATCC PRA-98 / G3) TaxID=412133 RepID=A2FH96_TRIV3|nr:armadillo (ARM) repeat-containing protein family [Trichomonas vaginalis G3]EAX95734.1 hypothetical protein TVAG_123250 [Trichomonas vaginalis G3]KAI5549308.1 armadillo (ARM) repeat-containing protein family [Trichomonas vaginalis G3]|eukprot:XP_001308664.1 hypothetical protein [Trichomonas vaginalis G3]
MFSLDFKKNPNEDINEEIANKTDENEEIITFNNIDEFCGFMFHYLTDFYKSINENYESALSIIEHISKVHNQDLSSYYSEESLPNIFTETNFVNLAIEILNSPSRDILSSQNESLESQILSKVLKILNVAAQYSPSICKMIFDANFMDIIINPELEETLSQHNFLGAIQLLEHIYKFCPADVLVASYNSGFIDRLLERVKHEIKASPEQNKSDQIICTCLSTYFSRSLAIGDAKLREKAYLFISLILNLNMDSYLPVMRLLYFLLTCLGQDFQPVMSIRDLLKLNNEGELIMLSIIPMVNTSDDDLREIATNICLILTNSINLVSPRIIYSFMIKAPWSAITNTIVTKEYDTADKLLLIIKNLLRLDFLVNVPPKHQMPERFFQKFTQLGIFESLFVNYENIAYKCRQTVVEIILLYIRYCMKFDYNEIRLRYIFDKNILSHCIEYITDEDLKITEDIIGTLFKFMDYLSRTYQQIYEYALELFREWDIGDQLLQLEGSEIDEIAHSFYLMIYPEE